MSPKSPDPRIRTALIEKAAALLVEHGADALTTRRLADELGASTMAVYTYFSGMDELRAAVAREGFQRLAGYLDAVRRSDDTVADVAMMGAAYFLNAIANPNLYRFVFLEHPHDEDDSVGQSTFERLIAAVARAVDSERFAKADPERLATQLWASAHGIVTLHLAGLWTLDEALECFMEMGRNLFVAFGDDPDAAQQSIETAQRRMQEGETGETFPTLRRPEDA